jgi:hypothetical protein
VRNDSDLLFPLIFNAQSAGDTFIPASLVKGDVVWLLDAAGASKLKI